jgi:molecular chaperone GrpE (heat shock protein)
VARGRLVEEKARRLLALAAHFSETVRMNNVTNWKIPKLPFLIGNLLLLGFAYFIVWKSRHPISQGEAVLCIVVVAIGAVVGCLPFILDYRAIGKMIEVNALGAVADKIQDLEKLAAQINSATNEWMNVQSQAEKTSAGSKEVAEKMAGEVREFSQFMQKINDSEKATLRLEAEKLRRAEGEWLQILVRILDHIFVLNLAAARSGQPELAGQIANFQNACLGVARRVGLVSFIAEPNKPFDPERHQVAGSRTQPTADAVVGETAGAGYTFQGRLLRPAVVHLRKENIPATASIETTTSAKTPVLESDEDPDQLSL